MRRFHYDYALELRFSAPVMRHSFLLRMSPPTDACQQIWSAELSAEPGCALPLTRDGFGNLCAAGHIEGPHAGFALRARGEALLRGGRLPADGIDPFLYALPTPLTCADAALSALAEDLPAHPLDCALEASRRIRARVEYRRGVTNEQTAAAEALRLGAGVCQDLAQLLLAVLRVRGVPARYAAGLIPGEGETHAWVEVFDGSGFVGVDPTQLALAGDDHLRVCAGRDSRDCAVNRGVFTGAAGQALAVRARMVEIF